MTTTPRQAAAALARATATAGPEEVAAARRVLAAARVHKVVVDNADELGEDAVRALLDALVAAQ